MGQFKIYISGQITGLEKQEYESLFCEAEKKLAEQGYKVVTPLNVEVEPASIDPANNTESEIWQAHLKADITELMQCEAIYMLSNWERSEGATLEHTIAQGLGMSVLYEVEQTNRDIKDAIQAAMGVPFRLLSSDSRNRWHVYARMIYSHHCKSRGDGVSRIASEIRHDESTVGYYLRHYGNEYKFNREFRKAAEKVATMLSKKLDTSKD